MTKILSWLQRYGSVLLFFAFVAGYGLVGVWRGETVSIDLLNYHLYNGYAFVSGRFGMDLMPAGIHTFLNPLPDVPYYLMIRYLNEYPRVIEFMMSSLSGVLLFLFYKFSVLVLSKKYIWWVCFAVLCAAGGFMFATQTGSPNNDIALNIGALGSILLLFRFLFGRRQAYGALFASALIAGAFAGLKYTLACVPIALFAVLCFNLKYIHGPRRALGLFGLGGLLGFLLTDGFFMWRLWQAYGNPVFPFYNQFFQSPFFAPENLIDTRFYPHTIWQWLFFPFLRFFNSNEIISEVLYDWRLAAGFTSFVVLSVAIFLGRRTRCDALAGKERRKTVSFLLLVGVIYVVWLGVFGGILRYVIVLEMFSCLLLACAVKTVCVSKKCAFCAAFCMLLFFISSTSRQDWGERRLPFTDKAVKILRRDKGPSLTVENNAMVLFWGSPMSFLSVFFPKDAVLVGGLSYPDYNGYHIVVRQQPKVLNFLPAVYFKHRFYDKIKEAISRHSGPVYLVSVPWEMMLEPATLAAYGLEKTEEPCVAFNSNINIYLFRDAGWVLCRLQKAAHSK